MKKRKELKRDKVAGTPAGIRESLKKATTEMLVLFLLERKPMYTYEMMQTIKLMSDGKISLTNLYIAIYRLEDFSLFGKTLRSFLTKTGPAFTSPSQKTAVST